MDLSSFYATDDFVWFHLQHPMTYEPLYIDDERTKPVRVALYGPNHPAVKDVEKSISEDIFRKAQRGRPGKMAVTADDNDRYARMRFAIRIADWENFVFEGQEMPCSPDNKARIFDDGVKFGWIRDQIDGFAADDSAFLAGTTKN